MTNNEIFFILDLASKIMNTLIAFDLAPLEFCEFLEDDSTARHEYASYSPEQIDKAIAILDELDN